MTVKDLSRELKNSRLRCSSEKGKMKKSDILILAFFTIGFFLVGCSFPRPIFLGPKFQPGDCVYNKRVHESWEPADAANYDIRLIMEVGQQEYRYCWPLLDTEARCRETGNGRHGTYSMAFSLIDDYEHKIPCPPFAK